MERNAELIITLYLDWLNNFLTVERFAEHYGITVEEANELINAGRYIRNFSDTKLGQPR